ncbi:MAG: zf-HC2 domain-containing protein [Acidobacteriia bacterium]|nr:zf-HC2 domain-containing protein [Terriglobia bacterium]
MELGACYIAGGLSDEQLKRLDKHLEGCDHCRRALEEFQQIASMGLPALAPEFAALPNADEPTPAPERTQQRLLARIENEIISRQRVDTPINTGHSERASIITSGRLVRILLPIAAALVLAGSVGLYSYRLGQQKAILGEEPRLKQAQAKAGSLQSQIAHLSTDRDMLQARLQEGGQAIGRLSADVKSRIEEIAALKQRLQTLTAAFEGAESRRIASEAVRAEVGHKLSEAQASLEAVQRDLQTARDQRAADLVQVASLQKRLDEFSGVLKNRDQAIQQQQDLLAHDRDIRDLIGARELYVAEVTDVGRNGETQQPFGRVFYTKGKSLIFYAYDLDRRPGLHRANTFQAWGRRGPDFQQALPLGILYLDSSSNRRWVVKFDDPKALARIDAVFVTVEPKGGSAKPSGKPLLFAYLKVEPNHP